jgi:hypothetical protein
VTEHFVTLFDGLFLPQGLSLQSSLARHAGDHVLWVLCMDDAAHDALEALALPNVRTLRLLDVETAALRNVKPGRTRGEYCWTITPFAPAMVFDADPTVSRVTYVDADVWFRADPRRALDELTRSGKSVQITEHAFAPECAQERTAGRFCVQFMSFVRGRSEHVRSWWADRCIEWCFARWEAGRFGDQMYLEDWPERFGADVHVLEAVERCQGPWNVTRFAAADAVMYHFHGLRILDRRHVWLSSGYRLTQDAVSLFYRPYVDDLRAASNALAAIGREMPQQISTPAMRLRALELGRRVKRRDKLPWTPLTLPI